MRLLMSSTQLAPELSALPPTSTARLVLRLASIALLVVVMFLPVLLLYLARQEEARGRLVHLFYQAMALISGLRITYDGLPSTLRPLMLIANHSSYLDIFVLGGRLPMSFTPKLEIRSWPVIGFFCVLADCVFIERRPADMQRAQSEMEERLAQGKVLALFPEGTTGDGINVKAFKSGFLNLVAEHDLPVQPVSIAYTHIGEMPLSAATRGQVAWFGDDSFAPHFLRLLRYPYVRVAVRFFAVARIHEYEDRKALARSCEEVIRVGLAQQLEQAGVAS